MGTSIVILLLLSLPQVLAKFGHPLHQIPSLRQRLVVSGDLEQYHRYQNDVRISKLASTTGKLIDYFDSEIIANISIGTPEQPFSVFLDTMSANLWVQGVNCVTCSTKKHSYNSSASSTFINNGRAIVIKGTTDIKGVLQEDTVKLGTDSDKPVLIPKQVFAVASEVSIDWKSGLADGVMGLGFTTLAVDNVRPPLINAPLLTIWLSPRDSSVMESSGYVTYGEVDHDRCGPIIGYAEVTVPIYFEFKVTGVSLGSEAYTMKKASAVSDPAFSTVTGPSDAIDFLATKAGAQWDYQYQIFTINCSAIPDPVIFTIGGHDYPMNYKHYIVKDFTGRGTCQLAFNSLYSTGFGTSWYIGSPFVRQYCHIYDYGKQRLGFAAAK